MEHMTDEEGRFIERRAHRRFFVEGLALNGDDTVCAHIIDMGLGGMAVRYADDAAWSKTGMETGTISGSNFHLEGLPLITVAETAINNGLYTIKRCGFRFNGLTPAQQIEIEKIIEENGIDRKVTTGLVA
jgi:hypothetical protein